MSFLYVIIFKITNLQTSAVYSFVYFSLPIGILLEIFTSNLYINKVKQIAMTNNGLQVKPFY